MTSELTVDRPRGPVLPQPHVPTPDPADRLSRLELRPPAPAPLWWAGAHGGAGESTLAALLPNTQGTDHAWPVLTGGRRQDRPFRVVLVARTHAHGLRAAQLAATEWASGSIHDVELLGLVLVADAPGRLPRPLRQLAALVAGAVPRTWQLPWVEAWRLGEAPQAQAAPRPVRRLIADLQDLVPGLTTGRAAPGPADTAATTTAVYTTDPDTNPTRPSGHR